MFNLIRSFFIKTHLEKLPDDIIQTIGNYLSISDIKNVLMAINRQDKFEYIVPEYKILNEEYGKIWLLLTLSEDKCNNEHPNDPVNRKLLLQQLIDNIEPNYFVKTYYFDVEIPIIPLLELGAKYNLTELVKLTIINTNDITEDKINFFRIAVDKNNLETVIIFLDDKLICYQHVMVYLFNRACKSGNIEIVKLFIRYKRITLMDMDRTRFWAVRAAIAYKQIEIIKYLLSLDDWFLFLKKRDPGLLIASRKLI